MKNKLQTYLNYLIAKDGSDLHLKAGSKPYMRIHGELFAIDDSKICHDEMKELAKYILTETQYRQLDDEKEIDCSFSFSGIKRFRVNIFHQIDGLGIAMRAISDKILSIRELNLPNSVKDLADYQSGLVIVSGVTGSGKSTTMAALLDRINRTQKKYIVSIEDPIEFIHKDNMSLITQRAVGTDTNSYANALRAALREDIDAIFIGEMRDTETVEIALHAANTGHLVFSTLHTLNTKESINRIISMFPKEEQDRVRMSLSFVLKGVIAQKLVKDKNGGRVPAVEIMKTTPRISELIREKRDNEILEAIVDGTKIYGTQSFDQSLLSLYNKGIITEDDALKHATNPSDMNLAMKGINNGSRKNILDEKKENKDQKVFDLKRS